MLKSQTLRKTRLWLAFFQIVVAPFLIQTLEQGTQISTLQLRITFVLGLTLHRFQIGQTVVTHNQPCQQLRRWRQLIQFAFALRLRR